MMQQTQRLPALHLDVADPVPRPTPVAKAINRKSLFLILLAAFLVNAAIVLVGLPTVSRPVAVTPGMTAWYSMNFGDLYDLIAKNLVEGNGYRVDPNTSLTMLREPGYPLMLAAAFKLGGYGIGPARIVCVLLAIGTALLLLVLARKITGDAVIALTAALIFLLYPGTIVAEARAGVEIPSVFTVVLFMLVLYSAVEKKNLLQYWVAGLLMGVAALVRSQILLFPALLFVYLVLTSKNTSQRVRIVLGIAALGLGTLFAMSPWIIRNYQLVHKFVPSATVAGVAAQEGLYTCQNASEPFAQAQTEAGGERVRFTKQLGIPSEGPYYQLFYTPQDEFAFNQALLSSVSAEYHSHPELLARCATKNFFFNFWFLGKSQQSAPLNAVVQVPLLVLALAGLVMIWKRGLLREAAFVLLYIFYVPMIQSPIIAHARHSTMIVPFLAILGAVPLVLAWRALRKNYPGSEPQRIANATGGA